jgi:16S rRNA (cytosine1407-C5)-methyltransferase
VTAAPGSKTTQICALLENTWSVTANEIDAIRFERLKYNIDHLWCKNVTIINNDARKLWNKTSPLAPLLTGEGGKGIFDKILADLPCSAEGRIFLKNQKSFWYWSEKNIEKHAKLQKQILSSVIPLLKSWWILVYSTCTIAPEENEAIVNWMIQNFDLDVIPIDMEYKYLKKWITEFQWETYHPSCKNTIRCIPSDETEGFYIAKLRKK